MTAAELIKRAYKIVGDTRGWQVRIADLMGVTPQTINNWVSGRVPVPHWADKVLEVLEYTDDDAEQLFNEQLFKYRKRKIK